MKTILLADDSITIQKVVELTFSDGDYQVICVSNGAQALKKIGETRPDLILLDVIMPEKNGYEVCEQVKRSPATSGIPVLLLTGTFEPFDKKRAELAGADGHLTKPFESQLLVARVEELIAARPRLADSDQAGAMDVISGGEVYRVDPGQAERMRPVPPAGPAAPRPPAGGLQAGPPPPPPAGDRADGAMPSASAAGPPPGSDPGGSYVGFADVGFGEEEPGIVPDRFDESVSPSTVRLRREDLVPPATGQREPVPSFAREPEEREAPPADPEEGFTGAFESEFELQEEVPTVPTAAPPAGEDAGWTPPPEAPPAETWAVDAPARPGGDSAAGVREPANGQPPALTPEAIELIAEKVVQRMSDRIVREIAWEIIPEVAETIVRRRIKELEENPSE